MMYTFRFVFDTRCETIVADELDIINGNLCFKVNGLIIMAISSEHWSYVRRLAREEDEKTKI